MPETLRANPYIGPTSFTENDSDRFFGRTEETRELSSLVIARRAVLLYAQSGSGKTSLLQAALIPELKRRKRVQTFPISRVTGSADTSGNLYVENALSHLFPDAPAGGWRGKTFSEAFGGVLWSDAKSRRQPHLVIFDQFEEIFTYHPELTAQREAFFTQLGECLSTYPQLSLLLSMREDYLADLEAYAALLPDRLRTRMRLERLGVDGAVEAIREPAALAGLPFAGGAAEQLVDNLRRIRTGAAGANVFALGLYIEPVQLQIVCRQLWSRVTADSQHRKSEIDTADLAAHANVDDALIQFYRDSLAKAQQAGVRERALRRWFGEQLITPAGTRGLVYRGERDTEGLPNAAVNILRDCYIIRADLRGGQVWYELAHDRLVEPVREDNLAWKASYRNPVADAVERGSDNLLTGSSLASALEFAKENSQELTREEGLFLKKSEEAEKQARARRRTAIVMASVVIVALSALSTYAFREAQHAREQETVANKNAKNAKDSADEADRQRGIAQGHADEEKKQRDIADGEKTRADAARNEAVNQANLATSERLATTALLNKDAHLDLAALLSLEGRRSADGFAARNSMLTIEQANPGLIAVLNRHRSDVVTVAFSPDGKLLASAGRDATVQLWDVASRQPVGDPLKGHTEQINGLAFSPDSKVLVSGGNDKTVRQWDVATRQPIGEPPHPLPDAVSSIAISPDGKTIATTGFSKTELVQGNTLGATRVDQIVALFDMATRQAVAGLTGVSKEPNNGINSIAFSPDGKLLASANSDRTVRIFDIATGKPLGEPLTGHTQEVTSVAFSPDSKLLASSSVDQTIRIWEVATRRPVGDSLKGHSDWVWRVAFSPDGKTLASASVDRTVRLWDVASGKPLGEPLKGHVQPVRSVVFSPDGKMLASASADQTVRLWDISLRRPLSTLLPGHTNWVNSVAYSPDGKILASASYDHDVRLWDAITGKPLGNPLKSHADAVVGVDFSPDGKMLASASDDGTVRLWEVATRQPLGTPLKGTRRVHCVAFSPDGRKLASAGEDRTVRLWDVATRQPLGDPLTGHTEEIHAVAFSHDGKLVASGGWDKTIRLWDVASRKPRGSPLEGHSGVVASIAFSPDGKVMASGSRDRSVRLWDVGTWRPLGDPLVASDAVVSVTFSPDGRSLAMGSGDQVTLWDIATRQLLGTALKGHTEIVASVAFRPDGRMLASASFDHTVRLWDIDPDSWAKRLCAMANRNLSLAEWHQFIGAGIPYRRTCAEFPAGPAVGGR